MQRSLLTILWICECAVVPASAQVPTEDVRRFVQSELVQVDEAARVQIAVGQPDARLHLAPCTRREPFLRAGARLWGHVFVGLRCIEGADWSINLPVDVRVYGPGLRAVHALPAGQLIGPADVVVEEVEWTREPQGVAKSLAQIEGRVPIRSIEAGQLVGLASLRQPPAVAQGDSVKLLALGQGFSIVTEAVALAAAPAGQLVRVRTESGKIVTGTARADRIVEVSF